MKKELFVFVILFLTTFLPSCSDNSTINEDKFIKIYTDLIIAQDSINSNTGNLDSVRSEILKKYNVEQNQYESTIEYYNQNPERWKSFFEKAIAYLETLKSKQN